MQYIGAGEGMQWFKATQTQTFLFLSFLHWAQLSHSTHKQPPQLKKSKNSTTMGNFPSTDSKKQLVNQKNLRMYCLLLFVLHLHIHLFSIQHYHKHDFKKCLWTDPRDTSREQRWTDWLSKEATAKLGSSASLWVMSSALLQQGHSEGYGCLAPSCGRHWTCWHC